MAEQDATAAAKATADQKEAAKPAAVDPKEATKLVPGDDGLMAIDGFGDTRVGSDYESYNPTDGRTDRLAVLPSLTLLTKENVVGFKARLDQKIGRVVKRVIEESGQPVEKKFYCGHMFKAANVHFTEKGNFRCLGRGKTCCILAGKDPVLMIPVPILKYPTKPDGELLVKDPKALEDMEFEILIWKLNDATFGRLRSSEKEFPLMNHDIKIKGKKQGKYVRIENVTPCAEVLWQKFAEQKVDALISLAAGIYDQRIARFFGRKLTELQIKELFGQAPVQPAAADPSSGVDTSGLIDGL